MPRSGLLANCTPYSGRTWGPKVLLLVSPIWGSGPPHIPQGADTGIDRPSTEVQNLRDRPTQRHTDTHKDRRTTTLTHRHIERYTQTHRPTPHTQTDLSYA